MNEYYIKFKNGGFSYTYADWYEDNGRDYVFIKNDESKGRVVVERWPKQTVQSIEKNKFMGPK